MTELVEDLQKRVDRLEEVTRLQQSPASDNIRDFEGEARRHRAQRIKAQQDADAEAAEQRERDRPKQKERDRQLAELDAEIAAANDQIAQLRKQKSETTRKRIALAGSPL